MCGTRSVHHHAQLVNAMAGALGVDLSARLEDGRLASETWRDMVVGCTGCANPEGCAHWLAEHPVAEAAPYYCVNGETLAAMRD
ncbi:DUF6455 family protein [Frigidibacter sp. MR17.14]|uniref:DUF6455 family protein n=1 Tax=Frigidibacter sp. MR17.14 TaxID=3126509 RepID=UPI003012BB1F